MTLIKQSINPLNSFSLLADLAEGGADAFFIDGAERGSREAKGHEPLLFRHPESFFDQVRQKAAVGAAGDFQTDPFFLLRDPAESVLAAETWFFSSEDATSWHRSIPFKGSIIAPRGVIQQVLCLEAGDSIIFSEKGRSDEVYTT